jgi:SHS2 domain-containing protein
MPVNTDPKFVEKYKAMVESLKNSGKVDPQNRITVREALTTNDMHILLPKTIETIMLDAAEPEYLASQFLRTINLGEGRSMEFINFGAIRAFEIAEGQELTLDSSLVA